MNQKSSSFSTTASFAFRSLRHGLCLLPALALAMVGNAQAASSTWTGGSLSDGNWSDSANWAGSVVPGATSGTTNADVATFNTAIANGWGNSGTPIIIDQTTQNVGGITFDTAAGNYVIGTTGGNSLLLTSGGTIQIAATLSATNAIETINAPLVLEGNYTFTNLSTSGTGAGAGTLIIGGKVKSAATTGTTTLTLTGTNTNANNVSGVIANGTGTNVVALTKSSTGTWELSGANTYTGATSITAGTVEIGNTTALGVSQVASTAGATIDLNGNNLTVAYLDNSAALAGGTIDDVSAGGTVTLTVGTGQGGVNGASATFTTTGIFSGLIKSTTGTVNLVKVSPSIVADQTVSIPASVSLASGPDTLTLTNANTYDGSTTVDGGILQLEYAQSNNGGTAVTANILPSTTTLTLNGGDYIQDGNTGTQNLTGLTIGVGASHIGVFRNSSNSETLNAGTFTRNAGGTVDFMNEPSGSGSNAKIGAANGVINAKVGDANFSGGTADILGGYATWNGTTWVTAAGSATTSGALGAFASFTTSFTATKDVDAQIGTSTPAAMTINSLRFNNTGAYTVNTTGNLTIATGGILETTAVGAFAVAINNNSLTSNNGQDLIVIQNNSSGAMTIGSNIVDSTAGSPTSIGLTKSGLGSLTISGADTFTGQVSINEGTLLLGSSGALSSNGSTFNAVVFGGTSQTIGGSAPVFEEVNGTLSLNGFNATVGSLTSSVLSSGTAIVQDNATGTNTLTINGSTSTNFAGTVQNGALGTLNLVKAGSSTQTIVNNTYTGSTTVNGGDLVLKNAVSTTNAISVAGGATLDLSAVSTQTLVSGGSFTSTATAGTTATLLGSLTVNGGSITAGAAGTSTTSTLSVGSLTFTAGGLTFAITDPTSTTGESSLINVTNANGLTLTAGTVTLSGGSFSSANNYNLTYDLFGYSGTLGGAATNLTVAGASQVNGLNYTFSTSGGDLVTLNISGTPLTTANWIDDATTGSWATPGNWDVGSVPDGVAATANLGSAAATHANPIRTVTLDGAQTVGVLTFATSSNGEAYTITAGSGGSLTFNNGTFGSAAITVSSGTHSIDSTVGVDLSSNLGVAVAGSSQLTIAGVIANTNTGTLAATLTKTGIGTLALSNANTYGPASSGQVGTNLNAGTILVGNGGALGAGDVAFGGSATLEAGGAGLTMANNMQIGNGFTETVDTAGNTFTLSGTISNEASSVGALTAASSTPGGTLILTGTDTYTGGTTINSGTTLQIGNSTTTGSLSSTGTISDSGALVFERSDSSTVTVGNTITGIGTLTQDGGSGNIVKLSGTNNYSGGTTITSGTLQLGSTTGVGTGDVSVSSGATFDLNGFNASIGALSGAGSVTSSTTSGTVTLTLDTNGHAGGTESGSISNTSGSTINLAMNGAGSEVLTNASYTGTTVILAGSLTLSGTSAIGSSGTPAGEIDISGLNGTSNLIVQGSAAIYSAGTLYLASEDATAGGNQNGSGNPGTSTLTVQGSASLTASALSFGKTSRVATNSVTVAGTGTLDITGTFNLDSTEGTTVSNNSVNLNGGTLGVGSFTNISGGSSTNTVTIHFNGGTLEALAGDGSSLFMPVLTVANTNAIADVDSGGAFINTNGFNITIAQVLSHGTGTTDGGLTDSGAGILTLTGANAYNGGTTINGGGTVNINGINALGGANYAGLTLNGGTLQYASTLTSGSDLSNATAAKGITLLSGGGTIDTNGNAVTYLNPIGNGGSGGLTVASTIGGGSLTLDGVNTYTGLTTINSGTTLQLGDGTTNHDGTIATSSGITDNGALIYNRNVAESTALPISGSGTVTVAGPGSQTLTGASTYSGGTIVSGTLLVNNASGSATGTGAVTVNSGGTLGVSASGGTGTISTSNYQVSGGNAVTIAAGANLSPSLGSGSFSTLNLTLAPSITPTTTTVNLAATNLVFDLGASGANDVVAITNGSLTLNGQNLSSFSFIGGTGFAGSGTYNLFTTDSGISGLDSNSADLTGTINVTGVDAGSYTGTLAVVGDDLQLSVGSSSVPEPSSWALMIGGLSLLLVFQARRRRN